MVKKNKMNSKQRVLAALNHKAPDRVPCNYLGTPEANAKLFKHFGSDDFDYVLTQLGVDMRTIDVPYIGPELRKWPDGRVETIWGAIKKPVPNNAGFYMEAVEFPYTEFKTTHDVENFRWPKSEWFDYSQLESQCRKYSQYAVVFGSTSYLDLINGTAYGRGVEQLLIDIAIEDPVGLACMEKRFEYCYHRSEKALAAAKGMIDVFWFGDDYGTQNGPLMSLTVWRKLFYPKIKTMTDLGHKYGAKVMLHSCGSNRWLIPDLIVAGVDIYDTVQPEAAQMDTAMLKADFGEQICFHGSVSTQKTLPFGTTEDVANEVYERIRTMNIDGGFIVAPAHNIQPDTPVENIIALYDAVCSSGTDKRVCPQTLKVKKNKGLQI